MAAVDQHRHIGQPRRLQLPSRPGPRVSRASARWARFEVRFEYSDRPDVRHDGRMGFSRWLMLRCDRVLLLLDPGPDERVVRSWVLDYELASGGAVSLLTGVNLRAHGTAPDGSEDVVRPRVSFDYSAFDPGVFHPSLMTADDGSPPPLTDDDVALVTLDDAPLPGVLVNRDGRQYYWPNLGDGRFGRARPLRRTPMVSSFARSGLAFDRSRWFGHERSDGGGPRGDAGVLPQRRGRRVGPLRAVPAWQRDTAVVRPDDPAARRRLRRARRRRRRHPGRHAVVAQPRQAGLGRCRAGLVPRHRGCRSSVRLWASLSASSTSWPPSTGSPRTPCTRASSAGRAG